MLGDRKEEEETHTYTFTQMIGWFHRRFVALVLIVLLREKKKKKLKLRVCAEVIDETRIETETKLIKYLPPRTDEKRKRQ